MGVQSLCHLGLFILIIVIHCNAKGDFGDFEHGETVISPETIAKFYTETMVQSAGKEEQRCSENVFKARAAAKANGRKPSVGVEPTVGLGAALLIFLGVGIFAVGIAQTFQQVRKHVYHDADNLDTAFDAGGKVSIGLTATTIVSQWTWSATLLQSSTVASKYGISGPYWYAGGATIQIIIFSILSIMLKTRAPGAKTFLQVIKARFGKRTHLVFCTFAFFTNLIVMMSLTIAGTAVLNSLVADLSPELAAMLLASVIGGYTLIGGLGATFYVSYFNTALIFVLILMLVVEVFYNPFNNPENPFGSSESVFEFIACWKAPEEKMGNKGGSYLTFFSSGGLVFGIVNIVGNFGTVFCDQAYWQSSVAAKPLQGVWGFISGGLVWFAIPFTLATTMGLAYLGLSSAQGSPLLTDEDVMRGLAAPLVAQKLLGTTGEYAMLFLILMAVMSTGSAEVIAVSSIVIYDVYQAYICPFKPDLKDGQCILCSRYLRKQKDNEDGQLCDCQSTAKCDACATDTITRAKSTSSVKPHYTCETHGEYKEYQEHLLNYKNWCIVICTFLSVPLCLFCWAVNLNLAWTYYFTGILISSSVVPIAVSIMWARATATGVISGTVGGCAAGMTCWLTYASTYPGGLSLATFVKNTGEELPMLVGNLVAIGVGAVFCVVVTYITRWNMTPEIEEAEWDKTRDIDNPLSPWVAKYKGELNLDDGENFHDRPPLEIVIRKFRAAKITAYVAAVLFTLLFVCIWPGSMLSVDILDLSGFNVWTTMSRGWAFVAAAFIIIVPMYQEVKAIFKQLAKNREDKIRAEEISNNGESQPLHQSDPLPNRLQNQLYSSTQQGNKQELVFQRLRNTLASVLTISRPSH
eukprot:GFUD01005233.1.p1 GENE.GFUD01005233.1~~GFUD01005233.1.p1  ORF type:complete len:862 (-),score=165.97 GFUD01005233.1:766-3351(-)